MIATGEDHSIREFVDEAFGLAGLDPQKYVKTALGLIRPHEVNLLRGDATKAKVYLNWEPCVRFKELVKIMVEHDLGVLSNV